jgi:hypothetical protein
MSCADASHGSCHGSLGTADLCEINERLRADAPDGSDITVAPCLNGFACQGSHLLGQPPAGWLAASEITPKADRA